MSDIEHDAILLVSFGGPESEEEVLPFLEHVVKGRGVSKERLTAVAEHYYKLGGKSPINDQNRALMEALEAELADNPVSKKSLPVYLGNRHAAPFLSDTLAQMASDGIAHAIAIPTSVFSSYSGCRQYLDSVACAQQEVEGAPTIDFIRRGFNHPGFIDALCSRVQAAAARLDDTPRVAFTAHSIPTKMAKTCNYEEQLLEVCELVAERTGLTQWQLVYQSRSGRPGTPWLEPDILDHIRVLSQIGTERLVIAPIGFVSDHMEVVWDLDREAAALCKEKEISMVRAKTVGTHPSFVAALREMVGEQTGATEGKRTVGSLGPVGGPCSPGCCPRPPRRPRKKTPLKMAAPES